MIKRPSTFSASCTTSSSGRRFATRKNLISSRLASAYNPALIPPPLALAASALPSRAQPTAQAFQAKDAAIAEAKQHNADLEAELIALREQIRAGQLAKTVTADQHDYDEATTRDQFIDLMLHEAGWPLTERVTESSKSAACPPPRWTWRVR